MNAPIGLPDPAHQFAHGGGCGCKIAPGVLARDPRKGATGIVPKELLVGIETADDAAVYRLNDEQAMSRPPTSSCRSSTTRIDFGRIAATNAISDVYAMGGTPIIALALVGMPINKLPVEVIRQHPRRRRIGVPRRRHPDRRRPHHRFGRADLRPGRDRPGRIRARSSATPARSAGDVLILGKPLGVGVYSAALKKGELDAAGYAAHDRQHHAAQHARHSRCAELPSVHALTDVTGFGLLGHLLEIARGAGSPRALDWHAMPLLPRRRANWRAKAIVTGASGRNWAGYGRDVTLRNVDDTMKALLTDPQTSGGLLVACAARRCRRVLQIFRAEGFGDAAVIGELCRRQRHHRDGLSTTFATTGSGLAALLAAALPAATRRSCAARTHRRRGTGPRTRLAACRRRCAVAAFAARQGRAGEFLGHLVRAVRRRDASAAGFARRAARPAASKCSA